MRTERRAGKISIFSQRERPGDADGLLSALIDVDGGGDGGEVFLREERLMTYLYGKRGPSHQMGACMP